MAAIKSSISNVLCCGLKIIPFLVLTLAFLCVYIFTGDNLTLFIQICVLSAFLTIFPIISVIYSHLSRKGSTTAKNQEKGSKLKTWAIPLPFFHFHHEPYRRESSHRNFIGRNELSDKFLAIMRNSQNSSGSYLITGYRGVGKTSFVKKTLEDYKNGKTKISYSVRLAPYFYLFHSIQLWSTKRYGRFSLWLHKCVYKTNQVGRRKGVITGISIKYLLIPFKAFSKKWRFTTLLGSVFLYLFLWFPTDKPDVAKIIFYSFVIFLTVVKLFDSFGVSIFKPQQWARWLFNPVLVLHINLGHEKLDTKQLLFDIVSLLKIRYERGLGIFSMPLLVKFAIFLVLALWLTIGFHSPDGWKAEIEEVEKEFQDKIFTVYWLEGENLTFLADAIFKKKATENKPEENNTENETSQESDTKSPENATLKIDPLGNKAESEKNLTREQFKKLLEEIRGVTYLSRIEYEQALDSLLQKEIKDRHILLFLDKGDKSSKYESHNAAKFCNNLHEHNENALPKSIDEQIPVRFKAESSISQRLYCDVDKIIKHFYDGLWWGYPVNTEPYRNPENTTKKGCPEPYCNSWISFARQTIAQDVLGLTPPPSNKQDDDKLKESKPRPYHIVSYLVSLLLVYILYRFLFALGPGRVVGRLDYIYKRIVANTDDIELGTGLFMSGLGFRRKKQYQPLDSRQCEFLLLDVLETNHRFLWFTPHPELIFIFDELDKIDPENEDLKEDKTNKSTNGYSVSLGDSVRLRKFEVEQLLSNLKNIITVAPCRFIFIAGRDMMDANLADQGEVNHLYSSLFDETLYIPSFLTDHSDEEEEDISSMVEQYVCRRLLPKPIAYYLYSEYVEKSSTNSPILNLEYGCWNLKIYLQYLYTLSGNEKNEEEDWEELVGFLLDFIYYLTYRSAGSPKKLSLQFEQFVKPVPEDLLIRGDREFLNHPPIVPDSKFLLHFNEREQYQVQLISHIFIMLHGETSHMVRQFGDKLSLSMFSILDYLFKYHSIAFSTRDLERMPDVLDIHRAPALPQVIDVLLGKMLTPYLQKLNNGVYEFRFLHHFQREVAYISQFSERDLAAFNFTLDESITIKQHYHGLLKRQLQFQKGYFEGIQGELKESDTHTLPSLHIILGDIYSLDREFSEALTEYRNALQYIEPALKVFDITNDSVIDKYQNSSVALTIQKDNITEGKNYSTKSIFPISTSMNQLILYVQILLKMGLIAERRNQYDNASAHYFQAFRAVDHILNLRLGKRYIVPNFSLLPLLYQPYICLSYIHIKRDLLDEQAEKLIHRSYDKFKGYLQYNEGNDNFQEIEPSEAQQSILLTQININWAEILIQQSRFEKAGIKYIEITLDLIKILGVQSLEGLLKHISPNKLSNVNVFNMLGGVLSGLGDACCALSLKDYYKHSEFKLTELDIPRNNNSWVNELKEISGDFNKELKCWINIKKKGIHFYLLSAEIYQLADIPAEAALSKWKVQYVLSYALSLKPLIYPTSKIRYISDYAISLKLPVDNCKWIFFGGLDLEELADTAFGASYDTHQNRLRDIGIKSKETIDWIAPPLAQTSMVLTKYWRCEHDLKQQEMLTDSSFQLRHMGAFPVHARILAGYLKARSYYLYVAREKYKFDSEPEKKKDKTIAKAFFLLVQAAEDGSAYEGGVDSLSPHLGVTYFLLWKLLTEQLSSSTEDIDNFKNKNKIVKEYSGEKGRFLSKNYCKARASQLLNEIIGRHTRNHAYTDYINRQYYLHGAFSDPYVQGLWAVDYAISPIVTNMINELSGK